jgi:hypothetical protein
MAAKSVGGKLQMQIDERGSSLQCRALPKDESEVSQDFAMKLRGIT